MGSSCQGNLKKNPFFGGGEGEGGGVGFTLQWTGSVFLGGGRGRVGYSNIPDLLMALVCKLT